MGLSGRSKRRRCKKQIAHQSVSSVYSVSETVKYPATVPGIGIYVVKLQSLFEHHIREILTGSRCLWFWRLFKKDGLYK
jgi:hypothetical protein